MSEIRRALLLVGSPRGKASTSNALLSYLGGQLEKNGFQTETVLVNNVVRSNEAAEHLIVSIDSSDIIVLAAPLYVDCLPTPVIEVMELIVNHRQNQTRTKKPVFAAIINSGFPEPDHNLLALDICRVFARDASFEWAGGLPFGGGATIGGDDLDAAGGRARHARPALSILAKALSNGDGVPQEAIERIRKAVIPKRLYVVAAHRRWNQEAKRNGVSDQLARRPYLRAP